MDSFIDGMKYMALGKQAEEAAKMQKVADLAKQQGANETVQGLARLAAEQAYVNANQPQGQVTTPVQMEQGGRGFYAPEAGPSNTSPVMAAILQALTAREMPTVPPSKENAYLLAK